MAELNTLVAQHRGQGGSLHLGSFDNSKLGIRYHGLDMFIYQSGDVTFSASQGNPVLDLRAWGAFGIKTTGHVENRTNLALKSVVVTALGGFNNDGEIRTAEPSQFFIGQESCLCNNGRLLLNVGEAANSGGGDWLKFPEEPRLSAPQARGVVNNGGFTCGGKLLIKGGLSYNEHQESSFNNLEMSGGDITVADNSKMTVSEAFAGTVNDLKIGDMAILDTGTLALSHPVRNLNIGTEGLLRIYRSSEVKVEVNFENGGWLRSEQDLYLELRKEIVNRGRISTGGALVYSDHCVSVTRTERNVPLKWEWKQASKKYDRGKVESELLRCFGGNINAWEEHLQIGKETTMAFREAFQKKTGSRGRPIKGLEQERHEETQARSGDNLIQASFRQEYPERLPM